MKRLFIIPVCFATACTLTISTTHHKQLHHIQHITTRHTTQPIPPAEATPSIKDQVHDQYRPIYDKIKP